MKQGFKWGLGDDYDDESVNHDMWIDIIVQHMSVSR